MTHAQNTLPVLEAKGVTVKFGGLTAVNDVSIAVPAGKIIGLIGPNGAGKSTLFSVLSGLRRPNAGQVFIGGGDVTKAAPQQRAGLGMARTFQHPELFSGLTIRDHVTLAYRIARTSRRVWTDMWTAGGFRRPSKVETERVDLIINNLNLSAIQHRPAMGLPLGLARLVELARSFAREPQFLLLDEASSGLDQTETDELVAVLKQTVATRGVSLLMVEHDVEMVLGMADYVYVLDFGILIAEGTPQEIRDNPKVRAAYLGEHIDEVPAPGPHAVGASA